MRWTKIGWAALAFVLTTAACGLAPDRGGRAAAEGFPEGQMLLQRETAGWLYSEAEGARSLGSAYPFDLSADGSRLLGARSQLEPSGITRHTELVAINTKSEAEQVLVRAGDRESLFPAQWSPDGSQIAYRMTTYAVDPSETKPGAGTESICVRTITAPDSRCFDPAGQIFSFDWSPDGESVLLAGPGSEPVLRLDIHTGATEIIISPGGDGALRTELDRLGYGEPKQFILPQWSASGRYVAALVSLSGGSRRIVPAVFTSDGAFVSLGKASGEMPDAFGWAPDRDLLAYAQGEAPYRISELYVHDAATGTDHFLSTTQNEGPMIPRIDGLAWSPDGRWIAFSRPKGVRVVDVEGGEPARELDVRGTLVNWAPEQESSSSDAASPSPSPSPEPSNDDSSEYVGFHPDSRMENGQIVMPLTFVDGSTAEIVAPTALGLQDMRAQIFTAGGLGGVDRTIDFRYDDVSTFTNEGPLEVYPGADGSEVQLWQPTPDFDSADCSYLVYRFGDWYVGVRACQSELSDSEKAEWARSLIGHQTDDRFLVLDALPPLVLVTAGGHEGPEVMLYDANSFHPMIRFKPGRCDPEKPSEGDIRTMDDGTKVSFNRIGHKPGQVEDGGSGNEDDWFVSWCEDGLMRVHVGYAYEDFAKAAAESLRLRDIALAD